MLTQKRLKELASYDPETGVFTSKVRSGGPVVPGTVLTGRHSRGYVRFALDGKRHYAHRIAYLYMTGAWPPSCIDHINRDTSDNRWANLRAADHAENMSNVAWRPSESGVLGAAPHQGRYRSRIRFRGVSHDLETYLTAAEAGAAYSQEAIRLRGEFALVEGE